jgi:hypothetical protein
MFGFYGWQHLLTGIFLIYSIILLDRFIDQRHKFPWHIIPLIIASLYFLPLITLSVVLGALIINLRILVRSNSFIFERLEGVGMVLIGLLPFVLPLGITDPLMYLGPALFIMGIDSFHKIGHRETTNACLMWITGISFFLIAIVSYAILFKPALSEMGPVALVTFVPLIGFKIAEKKSKFFSWCYYQMWQSCVIIILFLKYSEVLYYNYFQYNT